MSEQLSLSGRKEGRLSELFCALLCTAVVHSDAHTHMSSSVLRVNCWFRFMFRVVFCIFSECHFVLVLFAFVGFNLVSSVLSQEISWEERIQNDLFCLQLDVKHLLSNSGWASFLCVLLRLHTPVVYGPPCSRWIMLSRLPSWSWGVIRQTVCEVGLYKTSGCWRWRTGMWPGIYLSRSQMAVYRRMKPSLPPF